MSSGVFVVLTKRCQVVPEIEFDVKPTDIQRTGRRVVVSGWFYVRGDLVEFSLNQNS